MTVGNRKSHQMNDAATATILVVDDNPATRYSTSRVLKNAGFQILEAATGWQAVTLAASRPDVVVLDVNLPDIDGFQVCRELRARAETNRTPVIHLSATFVTDTYKVQGLEAGADGYLTHPVEPVVLIATVNAFLRTRQAEEAMRQSEAKFRAIFDQAQDGICLFTQELVFLEANPAMSQLLGRPREELLGMDLKKLIPCADTAGLNLVSGELTKKGAWQGMFPLLDVAGRTVELDWRFSVHSVPGLWLAIASDATERIKVESEREQLLNSERAARSAAERANRLKDDFLATLSHELRTPLSAIIGWAQILRFGKVFEQENFTEGIEAIERNAKIQTQLIEDLLDVSRITSGKLRLDIQPVDIASVASAAARIIDARRDGERGGNCSPAGSERRSRFGRSLTPPAGHLESGQQRREVFPQGKQSLRPRPCASSPLSNWPSLTRDRAFRRNFSLIFSSGSVRKMPARLAVMAAWDWDWRSSSTSSNYMEVPSEPTVAVPIRDRNSSFDFR